MTEPVFELNPTDPFHCPKCGKEFQEKIRWVDENSKLFSCTFCGVKINGKPLLDPILRAAGAIVQEEFKKTFPKGKGNIIEFEEPK